MTGDSEATIRSLEQANPLREPALRAAISALQLTPGTRGLDIGCGIGLQTLLLAEATHPGGQVVGLDVSPELLAYARQRIRTSPSAVQISFQEGDMRRLPFADNAFNWAWSADCVGYPAGDPLPVLKEIARVVRPGGKAAVLAWTSQQVLPGHAMLEARLNAECSAYAPYLQGREPEAHFLRLGGWLPLAGMKNPGCRTFVGEVQTPLDQKVRVAINSLFEMLWVNPQSEAAQQAWLECRRLCEPESPDFILDLPDYYAFFTYTMFSGVVEKAG